MDTSIETNAAHITSSRSWKDNQGSYVASGSEVKFNHFSVKIKAFSAEQSGDFQSSFQCDVCHRAVPIAIHQQRMLYYPKEKLVENKAFTVKILTKINGRSMPIFLALYAFIFVVIPYHLVAMYYAFQGNGALWGAGSNLPYTTPYVFGIAFLAIATSFLWWPWLRTFRMSRTKCRNVRNGSKGLLIDQRYAERINLPIPVWVEPKNVIREMLVGSGDHYFAVLFEDDDGESAAGLRTIISVNHYLDTFAEQVAVDRLKEWTGNRFRFDE